MAKLSQVLRDKRREQLIAKHAEKRAELRKKLKDIGDKGVAMGEKAAFGKTGRAVNSLLYPGASGAGSRQIQQTGSEVPGEVTRAPGGGLRRRPSYRAGNQCWRVA